MSVGAVGVTEKLSGYDFGESYRIRALSQLKEQQAEDAIRKVEEAQNSNTKSTLDMMDRHNEMVAKSQKLREERAKQDAIKRQNRKNQEEHTELLKEMAVRNDERRDLLKADRLKELV